MLQLFALREYLQGLSWLSPERVVATIERGTPEGVWSLTGPGLLAYRHSYTGLIEIEGGSGDIRDLLAAAMLWLRENAGTRDEQYNWSLEYDGEPADKHRSDVTLYVTIEEDVTYMPAPANYTGDDKITHAGSDWMRADATAATADTLAGLTAGVSP